MTNLTDEELSALKNTRSFHGWARVCAQIKRARGGQYPPDWWQKVMMSGLLDEVRQSW